MITRSHEFFRKMHLKINQIQTFHPFFPTLFLMTALFAEKVCSARKNIVQRLMMDVHYIPCNVCVRTHKSLLRENIDRHSVTECIQSPPAHSLCIDLNLVITFCCCCPSFIEPFGVGKAWAQDTSSPQRLSSCNLPLQNHIQTHIHVASSSFIATLPRKKQCLAVPSWNKVKNDMKHRKRHLGKLWIRLFMPPW